MAFAFNYVGHYVTPWDWINHPEEVSCLGRRGALDDITLHKSCDASRNLVLNVNVAHHHIYGIDKVSYIHVVILYVVLIFEVSEVLYFDSCEFRFTMI